LGGANLLFCSLELNSVFQRWIVPLSWGCRALWQRYFKFYSQGGNMALLVASILTIFIFAILAAFAAGYVMVAREQMVIDERLRRFTQ
jgi:hypothetical protein